MRYLYIITFFALTIFSCEEFENSAESSEITYLPNIEIVGAASVSLDCDATGYTDEGATATEGDADLEVITTLEGVYFGSEDVDMPDLYHYTYSALNKDSIPGAEVREIYWPACNSDLVSGIEGMYTASVFRKATSGATVDYSAEAFGPYWVVDFGDGVYGFSCVIGQFYEYGNDYGYGAAYSGTGFRIKANDIAANDFIVEATNGVGAFGGDIEVTNFSVDPDAKTISWTATWSFGYDFEVVLTQI